MPGDELRWRVAVEDVGERLDRHLARRLDRSRHRVQRWIAEGRVRLNGRPAAKAAAPVDAGDEVVCVVPERPPDPRLAAEPGPLAVLYEDSDLVVVDKPAGVAVHPGAGRDTGTLAHFLLAAFPEMAAVGGPGRPGIVHRLDLDTTGVLVVARTERAYRALVEAFAAREVEKRYVALVYGVPRPERGTVDLPLGRHPRDRKKMAVRPEGRSGRPARTGYTVRAGAGNLGGGGISWLEIDLETGRTHQIRVHMKAIGHPLIGDPVYGEARWRGLERPQQKTLREFPRPALHARSLALLHPADGRRMAFEAAIPEDLRTLWAEVTGLPCP